jgi:hypothetical protein
MRLIQDQGILVGNVAKINDWLSAMVRFSFDTYSELQEERINVGSDVSSYSRRNSNVSEYNYDAMLNFNKDLTEKLNLEGNIGFNLRNNVTISAATNGGLNLRSLYLSNSRNLFCSIRTIQAAWLTVSISEQV